MSNKHYSISDIYDKEAEIVNNIQEIESLSCENKESLQEPFFNEIGRVLDAWLSKSIYIIKIIKNRQDEEELEQSSIDINEFPEYDQLNVL